jgi:hypothetical protein
MKLKAGVLAISLLMAVSVHAERAVFVDDFDDAASARIDWLSDEFDDAATLAQWQRHWQAEHWPTDQLQYLAIEPATGNGVMVMRPHSSGWWEDYRGELTFQRASGDFVVTIHIEPRNLLRTGAPGSTNGGGIHSEYSLGGVMIRAPKPEVEVANANWLRGFERYVFLSMGSADVPGQYQFEDKTTRFALPGEDHSYSVRLITDANASAANLRIARIGTHVIALVQPTQPLGAWRVLRRFARGDLPSTLQIGLVAYTDYAIVATCSYEQHNTRVLLVACNDPNVPADPDLSTHVDFFRIARPDVPAGLIGADLSNPALVSDAQLLAFLGFAP